MTESTSQNDAPYRVIWSADFAPDLPSPLGALAGDVVVLSSGGAQHALDFATGERRWSARLNGRVVAASEDVVAVEPFAAKRPRHLVGLHTTTGEERWRTPIPGQFGKTSFDNPTRSGILSWMGVPHVVLQRTKGGQLLSQLRAVDLETGELGKPVPLASPFPVLGTTQGLFVPDVSSPAVHWLTPAGDLERIDVGVLVRRIAWGGGRLVTQHADRVRVWDLTGVQVAEIPCDSVAPCALDAELLVVTQGACTVAYDLPSATERWRTALTVPPTHGQVLVAGCVISEGGWCCALLDRATGRVLAEELGGRTPRVEGGDVVWRSERTIQRVSLPARHPDPASPRGA